MNLKGNRENYHHNTIFFVSSLAFLRGTPKNSPTKNLFAIRATKRTGHLAPKEKLSSFPTPHRCLLAVNFREGVYNQKCERWFQRCFIGTPRNLRGDFSPNLTASPHVVQMALGGKNPPKQQQKLRSWAMSTRSTMGIAVGLAGGALKVRTSPNFAKLGRTSHEAMPTCIDWRILWPCFGEVLLTFKKGTNR